MLRLRFKIYKLTFLLFATEENLAERGMRSAR